MQYLLDTHTFIWFINGDKVLPKNIQLIICDTNNQCFISIASIWEIAIKQSLNRLEIKSEFSKIADFLTENDMSVLPIEFSHLQKLLKLPFHHRDPFDRLIIAQAIAERLTIISKDHLFDNYKVKVIW